MADFRKTFVLQTDACDSAVAAILLQDSEDGLRADAYASRTLSDQESNYSVYELEALVVLFGVEKFRMYLEHSRFILQTDNQALSWVLAHTHKSGRLVRWALRISAFHFSVEHVRETQNVVADTVSRMFDEQAGVLLPVQSDSPVVLPVLCEFWLQFALKTARHEAYKQVRFALMMGYAPNSPLSNLWFLNELLPDSPDPISLRRLWNKAKRNLRLDYQNRADRYNRSRLQVPFVVGDEVFLQDHPISNRAKCFSGKLAYRYKGPFRISSFDSPVTVKLCGPQGDFLRAHVSQLKKVGFVRLQPDG
ncbi:hypothetical protein ANN_22699 [Periplaneta americana]|uniref:Reverse transcriptase RNase H-like domain-containing protein n=1 Tax=Periplaneta americana TaxID=6978 RepID=A0ABQ8S8V2_PERAM|nr:hypothetical protein ANN_22699 [Periplaneta americana]